MILQENDRVRILFNISQTIIVHSCYDGFIKRLYIFLIMFVKCFTK